MEEASLNATAKKGKRDPLNLSQDRTRLTYTSCYCEENVWKLCEEIKRRVAGGDIVEDLMFRCFAVFISNPSKSVPIWCQRASKDPRSVPVVWDYHVIFIFRGKGSVKEDNDGQELSSSTSSVYDLDTILPFPESFPVYFDKSFGNEETLKPHFRRFFRVISAEEYLNRFASDRRHMKKPDGSWAMPPPSYSPIIAKDGKTNTINECIDVTNKQSLGHVMSAKQFHVFFVHPH